MFVNTAAGFWQAEKTFNLYLFNEFDSNISLTLWVWFGLCLHLQYSIFGSSANKTSNMLTSYFLILMPRATDSQLWLGRFNNPQKKRI